MTHCVTVVCIHWPKNEYNKQINIWFEPLMEPIVNFKIASLRVALSNYESKGDVDYGECSCRPIN